MKNTELNLIPIFVAIYEEKSLSKAAARLEISQPAVSKALARLRDVYDDSLFHRASNGVQPTSFATDIYPALAVSLKNFQSTLTSSRDFDPKVANRVYSIACISMAAYSLIPRAFKNIRDIAPNITLEVHPLFTEDYEADLRLERYDLIVDMAPSGRTVLKHEIILEDELVVCCREGHPRIKDSITLEQYLEEEHVVMSRWHNRRYLLSGHEHPILEKRKVVYSAPGVMEVFPVILSSDYLALAPASTIKQFEDKYPIKALSMPLELFKSSLCSYWHPSKTNDASHKWLRDQLKRAGKQIVEE
ncbi:LysR family transcriptional regulator [Vibrio kyushuensis]|uniref:LysR family transcriptional regulator n=1 Tax=Vibrio kyushuensis TaxID=2910249 RepID=UPI003D0F9AE3